MRRFVLSGFAIVLGACTAPRVYKEGYEPPPERSGLAYEGAPRGTLSGRSGSAAGASGIGFFATQPQMYQAFAELLGGPISQGIRTYEGLEVTNAPASDVQARAVETLQARATRSARLSAREEGNVLVSAHFYRGPPDPDGSFLLRVVSLLEAPSGVRHLSLIHI